MVSIPRKILDGKRNGKGMDWIGEAYGTELRRRFREKCDVKNSRAILRSMSIIVQQNATIHSLFDL